MRLRLGVISPVLDRRACEELNRRSFAEDAAAGLATRADAGGIRTIGNFCGWAKSRLLRARAELRIRMSRHYGEIGPAVLMA